MSSFSVEDFVGNGVLKELLPKLLEEGWDDVPTLKMMNAEDMAALNMTQHQKDAMKLRSYLHDRALMQYGDAFEASGRHLSELLNLSTHELCIKFGMKRGHKVRFVNRTNPCASDPLPQQYVLTARKGAESMQSRTSSLLRKSFASVSSGKSYSNEKYIEESLASFKIKDGHVFKGIVAAAPAEDRACGCVKPPPVVDQVAPLSAIEDISVQKLTPEYKIGMEPLVKTSTPPMKASLLWKDKPAVLLCIRRPGCIMCRAEAHQLYNKKPLFDALGIQLIAVLHEQIESEVRDFWPRYWGGVVVHDKGMGFFKALGGGRLLKDKFISGFVLNPRAIANYKRAKAMGMRQNFRGEGEIKGGLFAVGCGRSGIAYQFIERNFGDWAPVAQVIGICTKLQGLQNQQEEQAESGKASRKSYTVKSVINF